MLSVKRAIEAGEALIDLRDDYTNPASTERGLDPLLYAYLSAAFPNARVSRQVHVRFFGSSKPSRIDFRIGGTSPTVMEFAVRPPGGLQELNGPQNRDELIKLSKIPKSKAKHRLLLLIDLRRRPLKRERLKDTYDWINAGKGRKERQPVTVVYVSRRISYSFRWRPYTE